MVTTTSPVEYKLLILSLTIIVFGGLLFLLFLLGYTLFSDGGSEWRTEIVKDLCERNNLSFQLEETPETPETPYCFSFEGDMRIRYYAPEYWSSDFMIKENQWLEKS